MKQLKKTLELKKLFRIFEEQKIVYLVLKNYDDFEHSNDIDLLIKSSSKLKGILKEQGYSLKTIKEDFGVIKGDLTLHIRIDGINYGGAILRNTGEIFSSRVRYKFFHILKKEDLFIHRVLHAILNKRKFRKDYIKEIEKLSKKIDKKEVRRKLKEDFGGLGIELFHLIDKKKYEKALKLRIRLLIKIFTIKSFMNYLLRGLIGLVNFSLFYSFLRQAKIPK